jgi:hypothetical protein
MPNNPVLILKDNKVIHASYDSEKIFGHYSFLLKGKSLKNLVEKASFDKIQKMRTNEALNMILITRNSKKYDVQIAKLKFDITEILIIYFDVPKTINKRIDNINIDNRTLFEYFINSSKYEISESIADIEINIENKNKIQALKEKVSCFYDDLVDLFHNNETTHFEIFNIEPIIKDVIDIIDVKSGHKSNIILVNSLENGHVYGNKNKFIDLINTTVSNCIKSDTLSIKMFEEECNAIISITHSNEKNAFESDFLKNNDEINALAKEAGATIFTYFDVHKGCRTVISYNLLRAYRLYE